jgi:hypothetical protein
MKRTGLLLALLLAYLFYGIFLSRFDLTIIPSGLSPKDPEGFHDYVGVVNVHTTLSSGSGSPQEVIQAAQNAKLDFIFLTDLNVFSPPAPGLAGYHENLLVFVDGEYSYLNSRLLNLGVNTERDLSGPGRAQMYFSDLLGQKERSINQGLLILAHPFKNKYAWAGEFPVGLDGIEVINLKTLWHRSWTDSRWSFFWSMLIFPFNDRLALLRLFQDPKKEVALWDELNSRRPTLGFAGTDADARFRFGKDLHIGYPSYETLFSLVRNHVLLTSELTGESITDREKILSALRRGHFYLSLDILANAKGFLATVETKNGEVFLPGSQISWQTGLQLEVQLPHRPNVPFEVEVYQDGERIVQSNSQTTKVALHAPGAYRVKVRVIPTLPLPDGKKWIPWIYTNPFFVRR